MKTALMHCKLRALLLLGLLSFLFLGCDPPVAIPTPAEGEQAVVATVFDGDSVALADGREIRYVGINTPERGQYFYEEATEANRRFVDGKAIWLVADTQSVDQYGRILAYVWVGSKFVNLELVRQGYASAYTEPPNVRYSKELLAAEQEAREAQRGLWVPANVAIRIQSIHYDAPGPDPQNPNGEWVELANTGSAAVDLTGFTLKDEANHIYTFPAVRLHPDQSLKLYSGQGSDSDEDLFWGLSGDSIWSNSGDTAFLRDPQGRLVDSYRY